jgi:hypothetical protein
MQHTFNRTAVSGSIIRRTSLTSWLTLPPTRDPPIRITIDLGVLLIEEALPLPLAGPLGTFGFVRVFVCLAMLYS